MSGVWFVVSVPCEWYEKQLKGGKTDAKDKNDSKVSENNKKNQANGIISVEIYDENKKPVPIIPHSPKNDKKSEKKDDEGDDEKSLEWHLKDCLDKLAIFDAVWIKSKEETFYQVFFPCEGPGVECDFVLQSLQNRGIGDKGLSTVGIMPCDVFYRDLGVEEDTNEDSGDENGMDDMEKKTGGGNKGFKAMQKEFLKSVTARLTVAQVVEKVRGDAGLTFDFIMFVIIASCIAALGLSENSAIIIVAAMLISPIMGPIMAFTFGLTIRDKKLIYMAMRTELIGLTMCMLSGFLFGFICGNFSESWGAGKWPTTEMAGRGMIRSLWSGCLIALPSGAGVAMSLLQGNGASLVGVAISASLLPPTVNCGLLWGLAAIKSVRGLYQHHYVVYDIYNHTVKPALLPPDTYTPTYYPLMDKECAVLGIISFLLTVLNIICIIFSALFILKIKEVAPNTTEPAVSRFWKHDVKIARDYNKSLGNADGEQLGKQFLQEWANLNGLDPNTVMNPDNEASQLQTLMDIVETAEEDDVFKSISMSVPSAPERMARRLSVLPPGLGAGFGGGDSDEPSNHLGARLRRSSIAANKQLQKKRRQSRVAGLMESLAEDEEVSPSPGSKPNIPDINVSRFNVSPVEDDAPPPSVLRAAQRRRRNSCFPTNNPINMHQSLSPSKSNGSENETTNF